MDKFAIELNRLFAKAREESKHWGRPHRRGVRRIVNEDQFWFEAGKNGEIIESVEPQENRTVIKTASDNIYYVKQKYVENR